ncbi:hypothetical protein CsSME_00018162 [Camellia sinensis var. sinensis]
MYVSVKEVESRPIFGCSAGKKTVGKERERERERVQPKGEEERKRVSWVVKIQAKNCGKIILRSRAIVWLVYLLCPVCLICFYSYLDILGIV